MQTHDIDKLLGQIETLEYEMSVLKDSLTATQRNYDSVSRLLHEERLKVNEKEKNVLKRNLELEGLLKVESSRVKVGQPHAGLDRPSRSA